jgi:hypothetical protein
MNKQATQILQLGVFLSALVVFLDIFLMQLPVLDWLGLGVAFFFVAILILDLTAQLAHQEKHPATSKHQEHDELEWLEELADRAVHGHHPESINVLSERLRSLAITTVAARKRLTRKELQELADNDPKSLDSIVKDAQMVKLLARNASALKTGSRLEFEELISRIVNWSP